MPVYGTIASQFNDPGTNTLYNNIITIINERTEVDFKGEMDFDTGDSEKIYIIPPSRVRYLSEISENNRNYDTWVLKQSEYASQAYALKISLAQFEADSDLSKAIQEKYDHIMEDMDGSCKRMLENWNETIARYKADEYIYKVRDKEIRVPTHTESLSHTQIPRVVLPKHRDLSLIHISEPTRPY